jgi:predicted nucleotidyltransferase
MTIDKVREKEYTRKLKQEVLRRSESFVCSIFLFGSRVSGELKRSSDFDIGVRGLSEREFSRLKRLLEGIEDDLNLPHSVDIVDFERVDESFAARIDREGVDVWKQS